MTKTCSVPSLPLRVVAGLAVMVLLGGCSSGNSPAARPARASAQSATAPSAATATAPSAATTAPPPPTVYVAVGASETVGIGADDPAGEAWPQVLHDSALSTSTLVNVGVSGATVRDALNTQLPQAVAAEPDVVTVWLAVNDLIGLAPVRDYETQLQRLVAALREGGEAQVLVGNVPDLWRLPAYRACLPGSDVAELSCLLPSVPSVADVRAIVEEFNAAIERVVDAEGAELVDLSGRGELTGLTAADGFHPSIAGHQEIAEAFERALAL